MPTKESPRRKSVSPPAVAAKSKPAAELKIHNVAKKIPVRASRQVAESNNAADAEPPSDGNMSSLNIKRKTYSFTMPKVEHETIVALKKKMSDIIGSKIKKSDIIRASMLFFLNQPDSKIQASLGKISAIDGSTEGQKNKTAVPL